MKRCTSLFYGLVIMNENNIIHYDIKPINITFDKNAFKYRFDVYFKN